MLNPTNIEWAEFVWNPVTGCTPSSPGCKNCYAKGYASRFWKGREFSTLKYHPDRLELPLRRKKPSKVFLGSMTDIFHDDIPTYTLVDIFDVMDRCPQHSFFILTKRAERMKNFIRESTRFQYMSNVYFGISAEDEVRFDDRIRRLMSTPVRNSFVSFEPLLGPIPKFNLFAPCLSLVIAGAETGPKRRPMDLNWVRPIRDVCCRLNTPFFFKKDSKGSGVLDGRIHQDMPGKVPPVWLW